ncbi:MAG: MFS transporter, partial [Chloroflexota bacterium]|nr:MFS transporter [Chloroflexota bacterium]
FTLLEYRSPILAGAVTFLSIVPGLVVSPIAGALLDRHGRVRLIILDYLVTLVALVLVGVLAIARLLPPPVLLLIAGVSSLTSILSHTGLRSLFPLIVPQHLWERVNAIDSNGYVVATILGPPIAATAVAVLGGATALILVGASFGIAAIAMIGVPDPPSENASTGNLLLDAWHGLVYTWRNPTLRGLGFAISTLNIAGGIGTIVVPLIVLDRLGLGEVFVGAVFAVSGIAGMGSALLFGRIDSRGREWRMLVWPMVAMAPGVALLLAAAVSVPLGLGVAAGLVLTSASLAITGLLNGPLDIALFTVRQRRTEQAWMGRAFAVSMAFNFVGFPLGAALGGIVAEVSLEAAIVIGIAACVVAAVFAATMIPKR